MTEVLVALAIASSVFLAIICGAIWQRVKRPYRIESVCPECHRRREAKLERAG